MSAQSVVTNIQKTKRQDMKAKLIIVALFIGLVTWYAYEIVTITKKKAEAHMKQLQAVDQE
jgi:hypothetical protein